MVDPLVQALSSSSSAPDLGGPRPHRFDVPALVKRVQTSDPYSFASFSGLRSQLSSVSTPLDKDVANAGLGELAGSLFAPIGTGAVALLASYAFFAARWYVAHVVASINHDHAAPGDFQSTSLNEQSFTVGPVNLSSLQGHMASEAFWREDQGESEIMKKVV